MGLSADAYYNVVKQIGNYDEIFSRNLNPLGPTEKVELTLAGQKAD